MKYIEAEFNVTLKMKVPTYPEGECVEIFNPNTLKIHTYAYPCVEDQIHETFSDRLVGTGITIQGDFKIVEIRNNQCTS